MSPAVKYTLGRVGLFALVLAALWPLELHIFIKMLIAMVASAGFSLVLMRGWRDQMANQLATAAERRKAEKERLRAALAGDDDPKTPSDPRS